MPTKKNHHFVPQSYLRRFTHDQSGASIGVFNLALRKYVTSAKIKNQASKDYFYGKKDQKFEDVLAKLETEASPLLSFICEKSSLPNYKRNWHLLLIGFTLTLEARTERSSREHDEDFFRMMVMSQTRDEEFRKPLDYFRPRNEYTPIVQTGEALTLLPVAMDLSMRLLVNKSNSKFVTSDNPVVFYNQLAEFCRSPFPANGVGSKGFQIFLPISPNHCLMFFDPLMYKTSKRHDINIPIDDPVDVRQLNKLQFINCDKNIYFGPATSMNELDSFMTSALKKFRMDSRRVQEIQAADDPDRTLLCARSRDIRCGLKLPFLRFQKRSKHFSMNGNVAITRNQKLCELIVDFEDLVHSGKEKRSGYFAYLKRNGFDY